MVQPANRRFVVRTPRRGNGSKAPKAHQCHGQRSCRYVSTKRRTECFQLAGDKQRVESLLEWRKRLHVHCSEVKITDLEVDGGSREFVVGSKVKVAARVMLGEISPGDVRVQAYYGALTADGQIRKGSHVDLALRQSWGKDHLYEGEVECEQSGSCGVAVRVVPFHEDALLPYELPWIRWED